MKKKKISKEILQYFLKRRRNCLVDNFANFYIFAANEVSIVSSTYLQKIKFFKRYKIRMTHV